MDKERVKVIEEKEKLINELKEASNELLVATIQYKRMQNHLWLDTDFEKELGKKRPTVDEKKAYVSLHSLEYREQKEIAEYNCDFIRNMIELSGDKLEICHGKCISSH